MFLSTAVAQLGRSQEPFLSRIPSGHDRFETCIQKPPFRTIAFIDVIGYLVSVAGIKININIRFWARSKLKKSFEQGPWQRNLHW